MTILYSLRIPKAVLCCCAFKTSMYIKHERYSTLLLTLLFKCNTSFKWLIDNIKKSNYLHLNVLHNNKLTYPCEQVCLKYTKVHLSALMH